MKFKRSFLIELMNPPFVNSWTAVSDLKRGYRKDMDAMWIEKNDCRDIFKVKDKFYIVHCDEVNPNISKQKLEDDVECLECDEYELISCNNATMKIWLPLGVVQMEPVEYKDILEHPVDYKDIPGE
jgi:hypothetical protein